MYLEHSMVVVRSKFFIWQHFCSTIESSSTSFSAVSALDMCPPSIYPNVHILLKILSTLPVSTAEPERIFSKLAATLTSVRSTMSEDRLESVILIQAHRKHMIEIQNREIINRFINSGSRKLKLSLL